MYPVTQKFLDRVRKSHTRVIRCELIRSGEIIDDDLPVISGNITDDSTALIRRQVKVDLAPDKRVLDLLPAEHPNTGGLWPLGNELRIWLGIDYEDGTEPEMVPQGTFRISKPSLQDTGGDVAVSVTGLDRSRVIQRARFATPYTVKGNSNYVTAIRNLVKNRMPSLADEDLEFISTNHSTPLLTFTHQDDPWDAAVKMAAAIGAELFWNGRTKMVLRDEPDPMKATSVFDYIEGEDCTMMGLSREIDEEETYSACVVSGESSSNETVVQGIAYDLDPTSPTWYDPRYPSASRFGFVPQFITSKYVRTQAQADAAAKANLLKKLGVVEDLQVTAWPNVAHESNDIIAVRRDAIGINNLYVAQAIDIGFGENTDMTITTRKRRAI